MIAASELAVQDVNEAGGVWGNDINALIQDEGPSEEAEVVQAAADAMVSQGANAIIGAASSTSSQNIIENLYNQKIIQVSPSNTGVAFSEHQFGDYYFRTAPSDVLQGSVLAELALEDGHQTLAILGQQTEYGESLAAQIEEVFTAGGGEVVATEFYDLAQTEYAAEASAMAGAGADAFVLISYEESRQAIPALVGAGLDPQETQWYFVDGNNLDYGDDFDEGLLEGVKATTPGPAPEEFFTRLDQFRAGLPEHVYAPESYDAVIAVALAAIAADTDDPDTIRDAMFEVVQGGTACTTFAECRDLLLAGEDIDYNGVTGPISWTPPSGDPTEATIGIFEYGADNAPARVDERVGQM
jgi:branched-chain amino acid transport system substrate-binding protein